MTLIPATLIDKSMPLNSNNSSSSDNSDESVSNSSNRTSIDENGSENDRVPLDLKMVEDGEIMEDDMSSSSSIPSVHALVNDKIVFDQEEIERDTVASADIAVAITETIITSTSVADTTTTTIALTPDSEPALTSSKTTAINDAPASSSTPPTPPPNEVNPIHDLNHSESNHDLNSTLTSVQPTLHLYQTYEFENLQANSSPHPLQHPTLACVSRLALIKCYDSPRTSIEDKNRRPARSIPPVAWYIVYNYGNLVSCRSFQFSFSNLNGTSEFKSSNGSNELQPHQPPSNSQSLFQIRPHQMQQYLYASSMYAFSFYPLAFSTPFMSLLLGFQHGSLLLFNPSLSLRSAVPKQPVSRPSHSLSRGSSNSSLLNGKPDIKRSSSKSSINASSNAIETSNSSATVVKNNNVGKELTFNNQHSIHELRITCIKWMPPQSLTVVDEVRAIRSSKANGSAKPVSDADSDEMPRIGWDCFAVSDIKGRIFIYDKSNDSEERNEQFESDLQLNSDMWITRLRHLAPVQRTKEWVSVYDSQDPLINPTQIWRIGDLSSITHFEWSTSGHLMSVCTANGMISVIHCVGRAAIWIFSSLYGNFLTSSWTSDDKYLLAGGEDDSITIFDLHTQIVHARCVGHHSYISSLYVCPIVDTSYRFVSAGQDGFIHLWEFGNTNSISVQSQDAMNTKRRTDSSGTRPLLTDEIALNLLAPEHHNAFVAYPTYCSKLFSKFNFQAHSRPISDLTGSHVYIDRRHEYAKCHQLPPLPLEMSPFDDNLALEVNANTSGERSAPKSKRDQIHFIVTLSDDGVVKIWALDPQFLDIPHTMPIPQTTYLHPKTDS